MTTEQQLSGQLAANLDRGYVEGWKEGKEGCGERKEKKRGRGRVGCTIHALKDHWGKRRQREALPLFVVVFLCRMMSLP